MSKMYIFNAILNLKHSKSNILKIIQTGSDLGFIYFKGLSEEIITNKEAVYVLMNEDLDAKEMLFLKVKYKDTFIDFSCHKTSNNNINVNFAPAGWMWQQQFINKNNQYCDVHRYTFLMLKLLANFEAIDINYEVIY